MVMESQTSAKMVEKKKPYEFRVFLGIKKGKKIYDDWTGDFKTKAEAMDWYSKHGRFHHDNGRVLGLFKNNKLLNEYYPDNCEEPKEIINEEEFSIVKIYGHSHVLRTLPPRSINPVTLEKTIGRGGDPIRDPNYLRTGKALCGILKKGQTLADFVLKYNRHL